MMAHRRLLFGLALVLCAPIPPGFAQAKAPDKAQLAVQARRVLETYCHRCHKGEGSESGSDANFLKRADLVAAREGENPFITPAKPEKSFLFERLAVRRGGKGDMPPRSVRDRPSDADKAIMKKWIEAGAPDFPKEEARPFIGLAGVLTAIRDDLTNADRRVRPHLRYFTLTHLHNNKAVRADHLRLVRAALAKTLNSLSWSPDVVVPRAVDPAQTVLAVDLRKLGWGRDHWRTLLQAYPYGLLYDSLPDAKLKDLDADIRRLNGRAEVLIHLRADWFVATATRPPLYHTLLYDLYLPELRRRADPKQPTNPKRMTARDLEEYLKVDVIANLLASDPPAQRAGFARSGVSGQNRLIERHPLKGPGAYWKSYDFKASTWEANLLQFPLGPRFKKNPFKDLAFAHDGGEIIFHLPNGLQGYLLVNGKDERIDAGPIEVVSDALKTSGTPAIVNGLSCMACHKHGMIDPPKDLVRAGAGVSGRARERVRDLYPKSDEMAKLVRKDGDRFLKSLEEAAGKFLKVGPDKDRPLKDFPEPVGAVARKYLLEDLDLSAVACELFVEDPKRLRRRIEDNEDMRKLGLGALAQEGGLIKRGAWESVRGTSQMQQAARELGFTPFLIARGR
jgi:serine/threonine-protein kinase